MATIAPRTTLDDALTTLSNERRRHVLQVVAEHGAQSLGTLARRVAARERNTTPDRVDADVRKAVYVTLYQHHLDTLADAGVLAVDDRTNAVEPGPALDEHVRALDDLETVFASGVSR